MRASIPVLKIALLGPPGFVLGQTTLPTPHRGVRRLLAYLALQPGSHERSHLARQLFSQESSTDPRAQLRQALFQLSAVYNRFGSPLAVSRQSVAWNPAYPLSADVQDFLVASTEDPGVNLSAIALYRGPLLTGEEQDGDDAFPVWLRDQRQRLEKHLCLRYTSALQHLHQAGDQSAGERLVNQWIQQFPLSDQAHLAAMQLLVLGRKDTHALYLFETFRERKITQSGNKPGPEITAFYEHTRQSLPNAPVTAAPSVATGPAQLRFVTVLVITFRDEIQDDVGRHEFLRHYLEPARAVAQTHDAELRVTSQGYIELLFGVQVPCQDGPQQALRAALALQQLSKMIPQAAQLGIDCGQVIVDAAHPPIGQLFVHAIDLARRQRSGRGVVLSATARFLLAPNSPGIQIQALVESAATDAEAPVTAYQVDSDSPNPIPSLPLFGRETEQAIIVAAAERVHAQQTGELIWIVGEAGLGKTQLLEHALSALTTQCPIVRFACQPLQQYSLLHPLAATFRRLLHLDELTGEAARKRVARMLDLLRDKDPLLLRLWCFWLGLEDKAGQHSAGQLLHDYRFLLQESVLELLSTHLLPRHHIAVIEDLHWADTASLDVLRQFLRNLDQRPILVLITSRSAPPPMDALPCPERVLSLYPWDDAQARRFLAARLPQLPKPPIQQAIIQSAGGIPLYLDGLATSLAERALEQIPAQVEVILDAYVARSGSALPTLQAAAVIGAPFQLRDLAALGERSQPELQGELQILEERGLLTHQGQYWQFRHELLRRSVYDALLPQHRQPLHQRWAEELVRRDYAEVGVIASHFAAAEAWPETRKYYFLASRRALVMGAYTGAVAFADAALAHLLDDDPRRLELEATRYFALRALYGYSAAPVLQAMEALDAICATQEHGSWALLGVRFGQWIAASSQENSHAGLRAAIRLAETNYTDLPDRATRSVANYALGWTLFWRGSLGPAQQYLQRVVDRWSEDWAAHIQQATGERPLEAAMGYLGLIDILQGRPEQGIARFQQAIDQLSPDRQGNMWLFMQVMFATMSLWTGETRRTLRMVPQILRHSRQSGLIMWETFGHALQIWALGREGHLHPSTATVRLRRRVREVEHIWRFGAGILHLLLVDMAYRGGHPQPVALYRHARRHLQQHGARVFLPTLDILKQGSIPPNTANLRQEVGRRWHR